MCKDGDLGLLSYSGKVVLCLTPRQGRGFVLVTWYVSPRIGLKGFSVEVCLRKPPTTKPTRYLSSACVTEWISNIQAVACDACYVKTDFCLVAGVGLVEASTQHKKDKAERTTVLVQEGNIKDHVAAGA